MTCLCGVSQQSPAKHPGTATKSIVPPAPEIGGSQSRNSMNSGQWLSFLAGHAIHPKLTLSHPGDADEREADAVADRVMRMASPDGAPIAIAPGQPQVARACSACEQDDDKGRIARKAGSPAGNQAAVRGAAEAVAAGGQPLDASTRAWFEPRFGRDLSKVRIHSGPGAHQAATGIGAMAFTHGQNIAFAKGQFAPETDRGRRLLAHELAHVIQQDQAGGGRRLHRKACGHDGGDPVCGGGSFARWNLVDIVTDEVENLAFDNKIVRDGLIPQFGGNWITQVQTPPNPRKQGKKRGFMDGARVRGDGALSLEIVEIKSCSYGMTGDTGGCRLATYEAEGYKQVLDPLGPKVLSISAGLAKQGGFRIPSAQKKPKAGDILILKSAGIDLNDPQTKDAWTLYNGLQNRLDTTFTSAFTGFSVSLFDGGDPGTSYKAGWPVLWPCKTRKNKPGLKKRQMWYQVNGKGGVSYKCSDSPCEEKEEKKKEQQREQPVAKPQEQPLGQPLAQPLPSPVSSGQTGDEDVPEEEIPSRIPIVVGTGVATTAIAIAAARRRAQKLAAERLAKEALERSIVRAAQLEAEKQARKNVVNLAERRAAKALAKQGGAKLVGQAASKAVGVAAAAAAIFLVSSGRAEAKVGFGPSPLEALYDSMTRSGNPPSDEMKALIESDPVLRKLAEQAAASGDAGPFQEEAAKRIMELIRDNPGEFTAEELEILRQASNGSTSGTSPKTREELRAAIDAAVANQGKPPAPAGTAGNATGTPGGATSPGTPGSTSPSPAAADPAAKASDGSKSGANGTDPSAAGAPGTASSGAPATTNAPTGSGAGSVSGGDLAGEAETVVKKYPGLSPAMQGALAAAPPNVRAVFDAATGPGKGLTIDDALVGDFLGSVPPDLTAEERDKLIANTKPITDQNVFEVMESLRAAVKAVRTSQAQGQLGDADKTAPDAAPKPAAGEHEVQDHASADKAGGASHTSTKTPDEVAEDDAKQRTIKMLLEALANYDKWDGLKAGQSMVSGEIGTAKVGDEIGLYNYTKFTVGDGSVLRFVGYIQFKVTKAGSKRGDTWSGVVLSSTLYVAETGEVVEGGLYPPGYKFSGTLK